jgi:hypothetical protein
MKKNNEKEKERVAGRRRDQKENKLKSWRKKEKGRERFEEGEINNEIKRRKGKREREITKGSVKRERNKRRNRKERNDERGRRRR